MKVSFAPGTRAARALYNAAICVFVPPTSGDLTPCLMARVEEIVAPELFTHVRRSEILNVETILFSHKGSLRTGSDRTTKIFRPQRDRLIIDNTHHREERFPGDAIDMRHTVRSQDLTVCTIYTPCFHVSPFTLIPPCGESQEIVDLLRGLLQERSPAI